IPSFIFEAGISTRVCFAVAALRMRVSISAMGSVMFMDHPPQFHTKERRPSCLSSSRILPARFRHTRQFATQRTLAEADAAEAELAHVCAWSPANLTAIMLLHLETGLALRLYNH